jgi:Ca-activated chloride channel family protein
MPRSLHVRADRSLVLAGASSRRQRHLRVDVVAPRHAPRGSLSLGLVLDRSGSMSGPKLALAREGAIRALRSLRAEDRASVVAYSDEAQVLIRFGSADESARRVAERRLVEIEAGGGTDLCGGWLRGCEQVGLGLGPGRPGRCLLLTDGLANQGITDRATIVAHAAELRRRGVTTSTLGVGVDFDELLLRRMAEAGGGNFYFAENADQLSDFIAGETGEAINVVVRDAALVLDLPAGATVTSPNPFRIRSEPRQSVVELGDLVADQVLSLVLTLEFPGGQEGEVALVRCLLWDPAGVLEGSDDLAFAFASSVEYAAEPRDRQVDREAMAAYAASARRSAAELGRRGDTDRGRAVLKKMAGDIRRHAHGDPKLLQLASELEREATALDRMDSLAYKRLEYATFGTLRSKGEDGMTIGTMSFTNQTLALAMQAEDPRVDPASPLVVAVTTDKEGTRLVESAGSVLSAASPHAFACSIIDSGARVLDSGPGVALSRGDELGLAYAMAGTREAIKIAFVRGLLEDGAASHWYAKESAAIVSLSAWDDRQDCPAEAFVAYEMLLHWLRRRCPAWDPAAPSHHDGRECWGELGEKPADIQAKIEAGDLCPGCRRLFGAAGVDVGQLMSLVTAVHDLAARPAGAAS